MNIEKKGDWDKDWAVLCFFSFFFSLHFIKQAFAYPYMCMFVYPYMSLYEYYYIDYI